MIAVCVNPFRDAQLSRTRECLSILEGIGLKSCVCPVFTEEDWQAPEDLPIQELSELTEEPSHLIVLGGDGTILAVVRELQGREIPIIGVNLGTMGFMTALEPDELSMLPEALVVWPVKALVDDTGGICSPNTRRRAALSEASLLGVPVPWALT